MLSEKKQKGFTLIELLVVIAIIGLLASVVMVSLNSARKKARIVKRAADMQQIVKALELYYSDHNAYPIGDYRSECQAWGSLSSDQIIPGLVPTYMSKFPSDPSMNAAANTSCYIYAGDGINYKLLDHNIIEFSNSDYLTHPELVDPVRDAGDQPAGHTSSCSGSPPNTLIWSWAVYSPGGRCQW